MFVIVTGDAGFFGSYVFFALKKWGGAVTLPSPALLAKLLEIVAFTHVMYLAVQAGVCYANPPTNVHRKVAALVNLHFVVLRLQTQRQGPLLGGRPHGPAGKFPRRHKIKKKGWRGDHPHIQPYLRPLHHPLLRSLRPAGPPGRSLLQHPPRKPIIVYHV